MNESDALAVFHSSLVVLASTAGPIVMAAMTIGVLIAFMQALTQIQEMTLTFVPKIFVVAATVAIGGPFMGSRLKSFTIELYSMIEIGFGS